MTVLVDSDILMEVSRGRNADVVSTWIDLGNSDAATLYSPVSVAELWAGARTFLCRRRFADMHVAFPIAWRAGSQGNPAARSG